MSWILTRNKKKRHLRRKERERRIMTDPKHPQFTKLADLWEAQTYKDLVRLENQMWKKVTK